MHPAAKPLVFVLSLLPFAWLVYGAFTDGLGANPAEYLIRSTGDWTLRFICIVLAVTPLRVIAKANALARFRRMLGLFAYFYVVVHLLSYGWFDMGFDIPEIARDIAKRPFILVGFTAFVLLTPLAATSFNRAIKALGAKRWQALAQAGLRDRRPGPPALLLDARRQEQLRGSVHLCRDHRGAAGLARLELHEQEEGAATPDAGCTRAAQRLISRRSARCAAGLRCFRAGGSSWLRSPLTSTSAARPRVL